MFFTKNHAFRDFWEPLFMLARAVSFGVKNHIWDFPENQTMLKQTDIKPVFS